MILLIGFVIGIGRIQRKAMRRWCTSYGLSYRTKGAGAIDDIVGVYNGYAVHITFPIRPRLAGVMATTEFELTLPQGLLPVFELSDHGLLSGRTTTAPKVALQNANLSAYSLYTNTPQSALQLCENGRVSKRLFENAHRCREVWLNQGRIKFVTGPMGLSNAKLTMHFDALIELADALIEAAAAATTTHRTN